MVGYLQGSKCLARVYSGNCEPSLPMRCNCCKSENFHKPFSKNGFTILKCDRCGLGCLDPLELEQVDVASIYDAGYFSGTRNDGYADYAGSEQVLRAEFRRTLKEVLRTKQNGKLLELGCAYGFFLMEASQHFECTGLELSSAAVSSCQSRGLDVSEGAADPQQILSQGERDVVVLLDVIEHLPNPAETMESVFQILPKGGVVHLTTGDFGSWMSRLTGRNWRLMTPPQHLYYFTQPALTALLRRIGFSEVKIVKPWKFVPLGLVFFQLMRIVGMKPSKPAAFLNRFGLYVNLFDSIAVTAVK